ncbi:hypothetical protein QFZ33_000683 [Arthrobacter globiformis]|nr:hypothetical protein [Arthrobacter globiformis]
MSLKVPHYATLTPTPQPLAPPVPDGTRGSGECTRSRRVCTRPHANVDIRVIVFAGEGTISWLG